MLNTSAGISFPAAAENESVKEYIHDGYTVTYKAASEWTGNQNINVTIENTGEEEICGWAVKYETAGEIGGLWNGKIYSEDEDVRIVSAQSYNNVIYAGNKVTFGYIISGESFEFPEDMILCNEWREADKSVEVSYEIVGDWGGTYQAQIFISNNTEKEIDCWKLGFDFTGEISQIWNCVLLNQAEEITFVRNNDSSSTIAPGSEVSFSFIGKKNEGEVPELSDFVLYENCINEEKETADIALRLMGYADFTDDVLTINWYSTVEEGKFQVLKSSDNEKFEIIAELEDALSYEYGAADFEKVYFKITQLAPDSRYAESAVIVVEYENGECNWEYLDTDEDGIPDVYEESIGTDINKPDTDDDGLTDYEELYLTNTDPLVYNSVNEALSDAEADCDEDGISNKTEIENGTNPLLPDTDNDGINDGKEAELGTDPVNSDTDGDGIGDGDELVLNLDPTSDTTDGIKDNERTTVQEITADSEIMSEINTEENPMKVSIEFEAAGLAESSLDVSESGYSSAMSNSAIVGGIPEFSYPEGLSTGEVTVKFEVDDSVKENTVGDYAENCEELQGIKRFNVFKYFEDTNMLLPIETFHDEEQGIVYTKTDCLGTYCVMDLEIWMQNLGVEPEMKELTETTETVEFLSADTVDVSYLSASEDLPAINSSEFNVVFYLDTRKSVDSAEFEEMKTMIGKVSDFISTDMPYINAYTYMGQSGRLSEIPKSKYYNVISEYEQENSDSSTGGILDISKGLSELCDIFCDGKTAIFIICSKNEVKGNNEFAGNVINTLLKNHDIIISLAAQNLVVKDNAYAGTVTSLSNGKLFVGLENEPIEKFLYSLTDERGYSIITANNYETVTLKTALRENTGHNDSDTDGDGITDWDEVDTETVFQIKKELSARTYLLMDDMPTIQECIDKYGEEKFYLQSGFDRFKLDSWTSGMPYNVSQIYFDGILNKTQITPIISDPTNADSDGDGLEDTLDVWRLTYNVVFDEVTAEAINNYLYYFLGIIVPPAYDDNGTLITSYNRDCNATREYFETYIWPYLKEIEWKKYDYNPDYEYVVEQQHNNAFISWSREAYGLTPWESFWFVSNDIGEVSYYFSMAAINEIANFWDTMNLAMKQVILGNYCDEVTITGTAGQIVLSIAGVDLVADIRDVTYDFTNWEWKWSHVGQTVLDSIGLLPIIGVVKNIDSIKNIDELISSIKSLDKFTETIICKDKVVDRIKKIINNADDITKAKIIENPDIWAKLSTNVGVNSDIVVLGKYNMDGVSYLDVAEKLKATYYNNPYWDDLYNLCKNDDTMWEINEQFLKTQTDAGKTIIFSHNPYIKKYWYQDNGEISSFKKEIDFLNRKDVGYIISETPNSDGFYYAVKK